MKIKFMKPTFFAILSTILVILFTDDSFARTRKLPANDDAEQFGFSSDSKVGDADLAGMRGGLQIGDLHFDFVITTQTLINGAIQQAAMLRSQDQTIVGAVVQPNQNATDDNLEQQNIAENIVPVLNNIIQSGQGNSVNVDSITNTNALLTVIQNNTDEAVIQNFNQLDLTVYNFDAIQNANVMQQMNFENIKALR
jgi:hypothetical protein